MSRLSPRHQGHTATVQDGLPASEYPTAWIRSGKHEPDASWIVRPARPATSASAIETARISLGPSNPPTADLTLGVEMAPHRELGTSRPTTERFRDRRDGTVRWSARR